jgi:hypothetical protein
VTLSTPVGPLQQTAVVRVVGVLSAMPLLPGVRAYTLDQNAGTTAGDFCTTNDGTRSLVDLDRRNADDALTADDRLETHHDGTVHVPETVTPCRVYMPAHRPRRCHALVCGRRQP